MVDGGSLTSVILPDPTVNPSLAYLPVHATRELVHTVTLPLPKPPVAKAHHLAPLAPSGGQLDVRGTQQSPSEKLPHAEHLTKQAVCALG